MADHPAEMRGTFAKIDGDRMLAFGWAYTAEQDGRVVVDKSGDFIDAEALPDLENSAYEYVLYSREADEMHVNLTGVAKLIESVFLSKEKLDAMGLTGNRVGWWIGFKVQDAEVWKKVKDGTYPMFSIRGVGTTEEVELGAAA